MEPSFRVFSLFLLLLAFAQASQKETFSEILTIWPLPKSHNLLQFEYTFNLPLTDLISEAYIVDKFPRPVLDLIRKTSGDVRRIEATLAQGRW